MFVIDHRLDWRRHSNTANTGGMILDSIEDEFNEVEVEAMKKKKVRFIWVERSKRKRNGYAATIKGGKKILRIEDKLCIK